MDKPFGPTKEEVDFAIKQHYKKHLEQLKIYKTQVETYGISQFSMDVVDPDFSDWPKVHMNRVSLCNFLNEEQSKQVEEWFLQWVNNKIKEVKKCAE